MKHLQLSPFIALFLLLVACDKDTSTADSTSEPKPSENPSAEPSKPKVNVAKLNQELLSALTFNQPDKALKAIQAGADPKAKGRNGLPVIFIAAQEGDAAVVKALIAAGANPDATIGSSYNTDGVGFSGTADGTVLGYAAAKGHIQIMQDLAAAGADVNGSGPDGTTPLMQAVEAGNYESVKWLIDAGADPSAENKHGGTALGVVQMVINPDTQREKIIDLLKSKRE